MRNLRLRTHDFRAIRIIAGLLLALIGMVLPGAAAEHTHTKELVFLTWSEYMDPELIAKFEAQYDAKINFVYFESDELRDDMLLATDGHGYDVVCANGRSLKFYAKRGWLAPISEAEVPNKRYVDPHWAGAFPMAAEYAVPFFWGTIGIAYRRDLIPETLTTWRDLFNPPASLHGKIVLVKDSRDLIGMALKSLGYSVNTTDIRHIAEAEQLLLAQKPHVKDYSYLSLTADSVLVKGEAHAAMVYSGDAMMVAEHNPNIAYVVPEEGTNLWVDYLTVPAHSRHKRLAMDFINFLNEPEHAAQLAQFVYYATPNREAEKRLPREFLEDPIIYPDHTVLARSEFYSELPPRVQKRYNTVLPRIIE